MVDYAKNIVVICGSTYNLDVVRKYLLLNHSLLCWNRKICTIVINRNRVWVFDWQDIFNIAIEAGYLRNFHLKQVKKQKQMFKAA